MAEKQAGPSGRRAGAPAAVAISHLSLWEEERHVPAFLAPFIESARRRLLAERKLCTTSK